jgi:hypothetical protein
LFPEDIEAFNGFMTGALKNFPGDMKPEMIFEEPLVFTSFVS